MELVIRWLLQKKCIKNVQSHSWPILFPNLHFKSSLHPHDYFIEVSPFPTKISVRSLIIIIIRWIFRRDFFICAWWSIIGVSVSNPIRGANFRSIPVSHWLLCTVHIQCIQRQFCKQFHYWFNLILIITYTCRI